jgi:Replication stress response SDE2 C-terminal/SPRY domain/Silencing defective 2 N-terminal ubiquitin domain
VVSVECGEGGRVKDLVRELGERLQCAVSLTTSRGLPSLSLHSALPATAILHASRDMRLLGGKGGYVVEGWGCGARKSLWRGFEGVLVRRFGALLRIQGRQGVQRPVTSFGACRDLQGRRLRNVNAELRLRAYAGGDGGGSGSSTSDTSSASSSSSASTPSGIPGWYLPVPSWAGLSAQSARRAAQSDRRELDQEARQAQRRQDMAAAARARAEHALYVFSAQAHSILPPPPPSHPPHLSSVCSVRRHTQLESMGGERMVSLVAEGRRAQYAQQDDAGRGDAASGGGARVGALDLKPWNAEDCMEVLGTTTSPSSSSPSSVPPCLLSFGPTDEWVVGGEEERMGLVHVAEVEGGGNFATVRAVGAGVVQREGVWMFEVRLLTGGMAQVGWASATDFAADSAKGDGVGDDAASWGLDGSRGQLWHSGEVLAHDGDRSTEGGGEGGWRWEAGDFIGCVLDAGRGSVQFFRNGVAVPGAVAEGVPIRHLVPAVSLNEGEALQVNLAGPFRYPDLVPDARPFALANYPFAMAGAGSKRPRDAGAEEDASVDLAAPPLPSSSALSSTTTATDVLQEADEKRARLEVVQPTPLPPTPIPFDPIPLEAIESIDALRTAYSAEHLKADLARRGLKCGGTPAERADRLWRVRGVPVDRIPAQLRKT